MIKTILGIPIMLALTAGMVQAKTCGKRDKMVVQLQEKYSENLRMGGLQKVQGGQSVLEIWTSETTGTYTVLLTRADGVSCVMAAGTDVFFAEAEPALEGTES